jgi:hypothetical protein
MVAADFMEEHGIEFAKLNSRAWRSTELRKCARMALDMIDALRKVLPSRLKVVGPQYVDYDWGGTRIKPYGEELVQLFATRKDCEHTWCANFPIERRWDDKYMNRKVWELTPWPLLRVRLADRYKADDRAKAYWNLNDVDAVYFVRYESWGTHGVLCNLTREMPNGDLVKTSEFVPRILFQSVV